MKTKNQNKTPQGKRKGIPSGTTRHAKQQRTALINKKLMPLAEANTKVYNRHIRKNIEITRKGVSETAHHAGKSKASTLAALDTKNQLWAARMVKSTSPKNNRRQRDMKIVDMIEMKGKKAGRKTKVMIGRTKSNRHILYSITSK